MAIVVARLLAKPDHLRVERSLDIEWRRADGLDRRQDRTLGVDGKGRERLAGMGQEVDADQRILASADGQQGAVG
ncbi:hypothetical protein D3C87_1837190 [compost metagenome]